MGRISITFRLPIVDNSAAYGPPYMAFRARDDQDSKLWRSCGHRHKDKPAVERCARSMSLGCANGAVNERIEICGFSGRTEIIDGVIITHTVKPKSHEAR